MRMSLRTKLTAAPATIEERSTVTCTLTRANFCRRQKIGSMSRYKKCTYTYISDFKVLSLQYKEAHAHALISEIKKLQCSKVLHTFWHLSCSVFSKI